MTKIFQVGDIFVSASSREEAETKGAAIARAEALFEASSEDEALFEAEIAAMIAAIVENEESDVAI